MAYGVDWIRLIIFFGIPIAVLVTVSHHLRCRRPLDTTQSGASASRTARRGMIGMNFARSDLGCAGGDR
jgi:hypothetical protein